MGIPTGDVCACVRACVRGSSRATTVLFIAMLVEVWDYQGLRTVNVPASSFPLSLC